ncbi:MAG: hypothetical protein KAR20_27050 [Candidatus Heimdallarchaeota archaeon]|nr:hypothetical protein [Candidatus Heimdallarchaeota archaeon]
MKLQKLGTHKRGIDMAIGEINSGYAKLDSLATDGLSGVNNSLAYRVEEVEKHFHSCERWLGKRGVQTGTDWGVDTVITPFQAISGSNVYGAGVNDEALVIGTGDTPILTSYYKYDMHRILVTDVSVDTHYKLRVIYGSGTMADAITAKTYTEVVVKFDATNPQQSAGIPFEVMMPRALCGVDQIWIQAWNATDNATIDFLVGLHEYSA